MACAAATARALQRAVAAGTLHPSNVRQIGKLSVTAIGCGTLKLGMEHTYDALKKALSNGINLVDTSTHYGEEFAGQSETMIGNALKTTKVPREEVVIVTKVGNIERDLLLPFIQGERDPYKVISRSTESIWHCLDPNFILDEFVASSVRMHTKPDIVLLHNPEFFLHCAMRKGVPIAEAWDEMYYHLENAFAALEALVSSGQIHGYGISGNFLSCYHSVTGGPNAYEALSIQRTLGAVVAAAERKNPGAGLKDTGFLGIQVPYNLMENGAVVGRVGAVPNFDGEADAEVCRRNGIAVMANRPLNAIPLPNMNVHSNDWTKAGYMNFVEKKPMPPVQQLFRKLATDVVNLPFQQIALQYAAADTIVMNGMRKEIYVDDALAVLRMPKMEPETTDKLNKTFRKAQEDLGADGEGYWSKL